jgi:hypothetical protein
MSRQPRPKQSRQRPVEFAEGGAKGRMFKQQAAAPQKPGGTAHAVKGSAPGAKAAKGGPKTPTGPGLALPAAPGRTAPVGKSR